MNIGVILCSLKIYFTDRITRIISHTEEVVTSISDLRYTRRNTSPMIIEFKDLIKRRKAIFDIVRALDPLYFCEAIAIKRLVSMALSLGRSFFEKILVNK